MSYRFSMFWWKLRCAWCDVCAAFGYLFGHHKDRSLNDHSGLNRDPAAGEKPGPI